MKRRDIENRTILLALTGSRGYGLATATSDYDYRGVFIATKPYYLGFSSIEQQDKDWQQPEDTTKFPYLSEDTCIYELKKFIRLSADNNPNILELLWFDNYKHITEVGKILQQHRQMFLSKRVKNTYAGYGYTQIKKLESHRRWLLNPPTGKPIPKDFGLEDRQPLKISEVNAFLEYLYILVRDLPFGQPLRDRIQFLEPAQELHHLITAELDFKGVLRQYDLPDEAIEYSQKLTNASGDFIKLLQKSQRYHNAVREYKSYQQWKKNRNPERAKMETKVGYDCKFAMQAIRLLRTGIEVLKTQQLIVDRRQAGDGEELLAIKQGKYSYEEVMAIANALHQGLDTACDESSLPDRVDRDAVNQLCVDLVAKQGWN